jgi:hypothetical protein
MVMKKFVAFTALMLMTVAAQAAQIDKSRSYETTVDGKSFRAYCLYNRIDPKTGEKWFDWQFAGRNGFLPENPDYQLAWPKFKAAAWVAGQFGFVIPENVQKNVVVIAQTGQDNLPESMLAYGQVIPFTVSGEPSQTRKQPAGYDTDFGVMPNTVVKFDAQLASVKTLPQTWVSKEHSDGSYDETRAVFGFIKACRNDLTILSWEVRRIYPKKDAPEAELPTDEPDAGNPIPPPPPAKEVVKKHGIVLNGFVYGGLNNTPEEAKLQSDGSYKSDHGSMDLTHSGGAVDAIVGLPLTDDEDEYKNIRLRANVGFQSIHARDGQNEEDAGAGTGANVLLSGEYLNGPLVVGVAAVGNFGNMKVTAVVPEIRTDPDGSGLEGRASYLVSKSETDTLETDLTAPTVAIGYQWYGDRSLFGEKSRLQTNINVHKTTAETEGTNRFKYESLAVGLEVRWEHVWASWGGSGNKGFSNKNVVFTWFDLFTGPSQAKGSMWNGQGWDSWEVDSWETNFRAQVGFRFGTWGLDSFGAED